MFAKVMALIKGIAATINLNLDKEQIKQAILSGLNALAAAATATPNIWDDIVVKAAVLFVNSEFFDLIYEKLIRTFKPQLAAGCEFAAIYDDPDLDSALQEAFANTFKPKDPQS